MTDDELVRAAFSEVKSDDTRALPSFESILARPASRRARLIASPVVRFAAAGLLIAAGAMTYWAMKPHAARFTVPPEVVALGAWRPPTDFLLAMPSDLLNAPPVLGASILDRVRDANTLSPGALR